MTFQGSFTTLGGGREGRKANIVQGGARHFATYFLKGAPGQMHTFQLTPVVRGNLWLEALKIIAAPEEDGCFSSLLGVVIN